MTPIRNLQVTAKSRSAQGWIAGAILGTAILAGAGYLAFAGSTSLPLNAASAPVVVAGGDPAPTSAELERIRAESAFLQSDRLMLDAVPVNDTAAVLATLPIDPQLRQQIQRDADGGRIRLVTVTVFDWAGEDDDRVVIVGGGLAVPIQLWNRPTTVAFPAPRDGEIEIKGLRDGGGGGITFGLVIDGRPTRLEPLVPGERLTIRTRVR